jgi:phage protein D
VARAPRLLVLADGEPLAGAIEASLTSTATFAADWFCVRAALQRDAARWAAAPGIRIQVLMALSPQEGFVSLIEGDVDAVRLDPQRGVVALEGRDLSAALIEAPTQEVFANRTSSEIATIFAQRHALAADVQDTTTPVGRYWQLEHDSLTLNVGGRATTEWDLLTLLAQHEGFDVWVTDETLHFRAPDTEAEPLLLPASALTELRLDRALTFAGDIIVTVKSWHSRLGRGCARSARTRRGGRAREYVFVAPNLSDEAAQALAERRLGELAGHEWRVTAEMPGELLLAPRGRLSLIGTGTAFDATYRIDEVERRLSARHGFSQTVRARAASVAVASAE